ncbi:LysR family transcriptional regulator [Sulfitobacter sp. SK011]|uniref:LysR family transcriptional regulator n=1 Tax=Sulfitobacter sp. SK011 TaxID=1389004 RepID=UPI0013B419BA|nr:LysR family transcriptional regulator [Sulfitobacter sp. SK011]
MPLNLLPRSLLYLDAVAVNGSIQGASRSLGISASAIDRQVLLLEEAADMRLFDRHPSGMTLTKAGDMLVVLARRWRNDENDLWSEIQQMQGIDLGHVRIAVMDSLVNGLLPGFIEEVENDFPLVQLEIDVMTPTDAVRALNLGAVDIAFAFNVKSHRNIRTLWSESLPLGCAVSPTHPLANETLVSLQQVTEYPFVLQSQALLIRQLIEADHEWFIHESRQPVSTNSLQLLKQMVRRGQHVAITSEFDVANEVATGKLIFIPLADATAAAQTISLVVSSARVLPKVSQLVSEVLQRCASSVLDRSLHQAKDQRPGPNH